MREHARWGAGPIVILLLAAELAAQTTFFVDAAATPPGDGSPAAPFTTIQAALDAASEGDSVSVLPGDYVENLVAPAFPMLIESQGGPLVTSLRAAGPGPAFESLHTLEGAGFQVLRGFTVRDSDVGIEDHGFALRIEECIVTGNGVGVLSNGMLLFHCTVVGNDVGVREKQYGVFMSSSIVYANTSWDYFNPLINAVGVFDSCVGLITVEDNTGASFQNVLHADPQFWDLAGGNLRLAPGSPSIGHAGDDAGALPFDPTYGAQYHDLGFALAGAAGPPALHAAGHHYPGETLRLVIDEGAPGAASFVIAGLQAAHLPTHGGTLVPAPDLILGPLMLDAGGRRALVFTWPVGVPSGTEVFLQAWVQDGGAPGGWAASNAVGFAVP